MMVVWGVSVYEWGKRRAENVHQEIGMMRYKILERFYGSGRGLLELH